jgi:hypothetical protein
MPSKKVLAKCSNPQGSLSRSITSDPHLAAQTAAIMPAAEAPTTSTSHFIGIGKTSDKMNFSRRDTCSNQIAADEIEQD